MLALAYAAAHPRAPAPSPSWGAAPRCGGARPIGGHAGSATSPELRRLLERIPEEIPDPLAQMARRYELTHSLYDCDPHPRNRTRSHSRPSTCARTETWNDMIRLQEAGVYPTTFAAIRSPVLMLHGAYDLTRGR